MIVLQPLLSVQQSSAPAFFAERLDEGSDETFVSRSIGVAVQTLRQSYCGGDGDRAPI
jgi:hypothetical protein